MSRVVGVISGKGGVGKTVVSINTAAALHKYYNMKVLLIDCNITTSHTGLYMGLYSTPVTLNDALRGNIEIEKTIYEHPCGISVVPASLKLEDLRDVDWHVMKEKIIPVLDNYDFIVLDSSPGFNRESLITLQASQEAFIVTTPIVHHIADAIKCKQLCNELNIKTIGIVLNMVRNKKYELKKNDIEQMTELPVFATIPYNDVINESIIFKKPVIDYSPKMGAYFKNICNYLIYNKHQEEDGFLTKLKNLFIKKQPAEMAFNQAF